MKWVRGLTVGSGMREGGGRARVAKEGAPPADEEEGRERERDSGRAGGGRGDDWARERECQGDDEEEGGMEFGIARRQREKEGGRLKCKCAKCE